MLHFKDYDRLTTKWVKSKGDVSGSNRKPFRQKKTGRAPQGDIRAPHLYHGGRAHGAKPRSHYFPINKKVRLMAFKSMLTSKFLENKIMIIKSEKLNQDKVTDLRKNFRFLKENKSIIVTGESSCPLFKKNVEQISYVKHCEPKTLNILHILNSSYLIFTVKGLDDFIQVINDRYKNVYRNRKIPLDPNKKMELQTDKFQFDFDHSRELQLHTPILKGSYEKIAEHFFDPEKLPKMVQERRMKEAEEKKRLRQERKMLAAESMYSTDNALEKRRLKLKKERRMKMLKEQRKTVLNKKKKMSEMASKVALARGDKAKKKK